ncbi:hypothetical protein, partial [Bradyrhizobium japonicum]
PLKLLSEFAGPALSIGMSLSIIRATSVAGSGAGLRGIPRNGAGPPRLLATRDQLREREALSIGQLDRLLRAQRGISQRLYRNRTEALHPL